MKIKEVRIMNMSDLRSLCIKMDWYTEGTNKEYDHLLNMVKITSGNTTTQRNMTTDILYEMANNIINHSDWRYISDITSVMFELCKICNTFFVIE